MQFTLASKLVGGKPICLRPARGFSQPLATKKKKVDWSV